MHFRLVRYFTVASLGMFVLIALALAYFQYLEGSFFKDVQARQGEFFKEVQESFARQQDEAARRDLLLIHENGNVNLTRLFANALWEKDFGPFVAKAQSIDVAPCRAIPDAPGPDGKPAMPDEKKACYADIGRRLRNFPEFKALDAKVFDAMRGSTVFKIKVFDLRGVTVYSSEHPQMGDDKSQNAGWQGAALEGRPRSELTHRDRFSAFEGVVEHRDLISSYLPVRAPGSDRVVGVFETYSDVTPFLDQIKQTSAGLRQAAALNLKQVDAMARANQDRVDERSRLGFLVIGGLLLALFGALFALVRRADRTLAAQAEERDRTRQRLAQTEKMASLGQMVAGVAHQLNTPLAFCHSNVSLSRRALAEAAIPTGPVQEMLGDTLTGLEQMRELVENLQDFTHLDRAKVEMFDINHCLKNVIYIARSVIPPRIRISEAYGRLPEISCNPSQLNQVFLNLINNAAQAIRGEGEISVRTSLEDGALRVDVADNGEGIPPEALPHIFESFYTTRPTGEGTGLGLPIARTIVEEHGGEIRVATEPGRGTTFTVVLPVQAPEQKAAEAKADVAAG